VKVPQEIATAGDVSKASAMLASEHKELLDKQPVSKRVNNSRTPDDSTLTERVTQGA
jgi:hypothetical protein